MRDLLRLAASYGLSVHAAHLDPDVFGYYSPTENRVYFDINLTPNERRVTVAHEIGHAHYGTPATENPPIGKLKHSPRDS